MAESSSTVTRWMRSLWRGGKEIAPERPGVETHASGENAVLATERLLGDAICRVVPDMTDRVDTTNAFDRTPIESHRVPGRSTRRVAYAL